MQYEFGSGVLWAIPTLDLAGVAVATPTPVPFGAMQDVSVDISASAKELFGLYQFPLAVARGTAKITGKAKLARFNARMFNLMFGETLLTGEVKTNYEEAATVANNAVTVANNSTFAFDLGVHYTANGIPLVAGATASGPGIYTCNANNGVYTFNAADNNTAMKISYAFTTSAAPGSNFIINNQLLGLQPFFKVVLRQSYAGKQLTMALNRCIGSKLSIATKLEDWTIPEFDFDAMVDDSNIIGTISIAEP